MGNTYNFTCLSCGYAADVSGGLDYGERRVTATCTCRQCKALYDVLLTKDPRSFDEATLPDAFDCPKGHRCAAWTHPGACPACGAELARGRIVRAWD